MRLCWNQKTIFIDIQTVTINVVLKNLTNINCTTMSWIGWDPRMSAICIRTWTILATWNVPLSGMAQKSEKIKLVQWQFFPHRKPHWKFQLKRGTRSRISNVCSENTKHNKIMSHNKHDNLIQYKMKGIIHQNWIECHVRKNIYTVNMKNRIYFSNLYIQTVMNNKNNINDNKISI